MSEEFKNEGFLHPVKCEWCGIKMFCNCWDGNDRNREGHIMVLCPRCQVTNFLNLLFGAKEFRSVLVSRIQKAGSPTRWRGATTRPLLKLIARNDRAGAKAGPRTKS